MHGIEKQYVFLFLAPQVSAWGLAFAVLTCFLLVGMVASTYGGIRGCLSVDCFDRWFLPDSSALGAGLPGLLGSFSWSYCLCHVQVVAATAAPPVLHTLRLPSFPRKLRLRLRILSGRSPLGVLSARFPARPRRLLPEWLVGAATRELASHFFPFPFPLGS